MSISQKFCIKSYQRGWLSKSVIVLAIAIALSLNARVASAAHLILYLAPPTEAFKAQMARLQSKLVQKQQLDFRLEFIDFATQTHNMPMEAIVEIILPHINRKPLAIVTPNMDIARAVAQKNLPVQKRATF